MLVRKQFGGYNNRSYSKPWAANVTFNAVGRVTFNFNGNYVEQHGCAGECVIEAPVGSIVAFGQKDNRGNSPGKRFYVVLNDGSLEEVSIGEAWGRFKSPVRCEDHAALDSTGNSPTWQPIETAPKDQYIIVFDPSLKRPYVSIWNYADEAWNGESDDNPTHWMSLPGNPRV